MAEYSIRCGGAQAKVKSYGGELCSFVAANGREYMWNGDPAVWSSHSPLLFPIVGTPKDGKIGVNGAEYAIAKHGNVRKREFALGKQGDDFIELVLQSDDATKQSYPFDFALHVVHTIHENGFSTYFVVENRSAFEMPFCIGGHPGFVCPMLPGEAFCDYVVKFDRVEDGLNSLAPGGGQITGTEYMPGFRDSDTLALDYALFDERDALIFANLASRAVRILHKDTGKGLRFEFPKFDALGIWTAPGKHAPYVCLEPWSGIPASDAESGDMLDKPFVKRLQPGRSYRTGYVMTVID